MTMDFQKLNSIFTTDFNIDAIVSIRQRWKSGDRYNYLDTPRRNHGFVLLTDYPAVYEMADGTILQANPGDLLLLPKGAHYAVSFLVPPEKESRPLMVNFRLTDTAGKEQLLGNRVLRLCRDNGTLQPVFSEAAQLYKSASPALLKGKVYQLFGTLFPLAESDECCLGYIARHYTQRFSIPKLADRCAMSETAYRKRFRALTGLSPVQYINRLKIEKACQMLHSGDMSPAAISDFLHFYSLPYFYKVFRDWVGCTPNEYRNRMT